MSNYHPPAGPPPGGQANNYYTGDPAPQMHYQQQPYQPTQTQAPLNYSNLPPPPPYTSQGVDPESGKAEYTFEEKFKVSKPKYNDLWAGILFIATVAGFAVVSALSLRGYSTTRNVQGTGIYDDDENDFGLSTNTLILFLFVLGMAYVLASIYFLLVRSFTKQLIYATGIANILVGLGTAAYYFYRQYYSAAIVFLIFGLFYAYCFWTWRPRIPFAVLMLRTAIDIAKKYGHVFMVSFVGALVALGFGAWFSVTFVAVYARYYPSNDNPSCVDGSCSQGKVIGLLVFITFAGYWITEFIKNALHTIVSGVYGSWYFCAGTPAGMPRGITRGSIKRTFTYSFGSVSFGSLLVSIIQMLRQAASIAQRDAMADGNIVGCVVFCCLQCILGFVQWAVEFLNQYAFSMIALYGKPFIPAAKDTWTMFKDRGFDALINDLLIDPLLTMGAVLIGYLAALLAYLYLQFTDPAYNRTGSYTPLILAFAFLIALQMTNVLLNPIKSGVSTIFVAMAWDPQVMMRDHRDLYQEMVRVYPAVQRAVHA